MMGTAGDDYSFTSPGKSFEVDKPRANAFKEVMAKIDSPFREAGHAIQGMYLVHLRIVRERVQAFLASVSMEEKWRRNEEPTGASQPTSARYERFAAQIKQRQIEHKRPPSENKHDYPIHNGIVILDSDVDEPEHPKVVDTVSEEGAEATFGENVDNVGIIPERDVGGASEREAVAAYGEDMAAVCEEDTESASEREVEAASEEDAVAACDEGAEEASNDGSGEGAVDLVDN